MLKTKNQPKLDVTLDSEFVNMPAKIPSLLLIPLLLVQGFAFPHTHAGMSPGEAQRHDAQPHLHLAQFPIAHHHHHDHHHHGSNSGHDHQHPDLAQSDQRETPLSPNIPDGDSSEHPTPFEQHDEARLLISSLVYCNSAVAINLSGSGCDEFNQLATQSLILRFLRDPPTIARNLPISPYRPQRDSELDILRTQKLLL